MAPTKADFRPHSVFEQLFPFEFIRTDVAQGRMQANRIVKPIDIIRYGPNRLLMRSISMVVDFFHLETLEKTLHRGVVISIAFPAHALQEAALL